MLKSLDGVLLVIAAFLLNLVVFGLTFNYNLLHLEFQDEFNATATETGAIGTVCIGIVNLVTPLTTMACQIVGYRPVVVVGVVMCGTSLIASTFISQIRMLILSYGILFGLGSNFIHIPPLHLLAYHFSGKSYNRACVAVLTGIGTGIAITSPLLEFSIASHGLQMTLRVYGLCVLCIGLLATLGMRLPAKKQSDTKSHNRNDIYDKLETEELNMTEIHTRNVKCKYNEAEKTHTIPSAEPIETASVPKVHDENSFRPIDRNDPDIPSLRPETISSGETILENCRINEKTQNELSEEREVQKISKYFFLKTMLTSLNFWLCQPMFFLYALAITFSFVSAGNFMDEKNMTPEEIARTLSLMGITDLVTRGLFVVVARCLPFSLTFVIHIMNVALFGISILLSLDLSNTLFNVLLIVLSLPRALLLVLVLPVCVEIFGKQFSEEAMSVAYFLIGVGTLVSQTVADTLYDATGSYKLTLHICAALFAIAATTFGFVAYRSRKRRRRKMSR